MLKKNWTYISLILALVLVSLTAPNTVVAESSKIETAGPNITTIPLTITRDNLFYIDIKINDQGPYNFIIDTGASRTVLFQDTQYFLEIENREETTLVRGLIDSEVRPTFTIDKLSIGQIDFFDFTGVSLKSQGRTDLADGIIGMDVLKEFVAVFNVEEKQFSLVDHDTYKKIKNPRWRHVKLRNLSPNKAAKGLLFARASILGTRLPVLIDTGTSISLMNPSAAIDFPRRLYTQRSGSKNILYQGAISKETLINNVVTVDELRLGGNRWKQHQFFVLDLKPLDFIWNNDKPLIILGAGALSKRNFAIDQQNKAMFISPELDLEGYTPAYQQYSSLELLD